MNKRAQFLCLACAPIMGIFIAVGWWLLAEFVPPPSPELNAAEVAGIFQANVSGIRYGMILMMVGLTFWFPFVAVTSAQIYRMEGTPPVLAYTQLMGGSISVAAVFIGSMIWATAAFRPDRDPAITLMLNDLAWLFITMPFGAAIIQNLATGLAIMGDQNTPRVMPRWVGFVNFWMALLLLPAALILLFKSGPFAWNGLLGFWVPLVGFSIWFNVMLYALYMAIKNQPDN